MGEAAGRLAGEAKEKAKNRGAKEEEEEKKGKRFYRGGGSREKEKRA